jgi:hypothetical protein
MTEVDRPLIIDGIRYYCCIQNEDRKDEIAGFTYRHGDTTLHRVSDLKEATFICDKYLSRFLVTGNSYYLDNIIKLKKLVDSLSVNITSDLLVEELSKLKL